MVPTLRIQQEPTFHSHMGPKHKASIVQVKVFWVVTLCSGAIHYQCFRAPCCQHLQDEVKMKAARCSKTVVSHCNTRYCHNPEDLNLNFHHCENLKSHTDSVVSHHALLALL